MEMMETGNLFLDFDFGMEGRWNQNMVGSVAPKFSSWEATMKTGACAEFLNLPGRALLHHQGHGQYPLVIQHSYWTWPIEIVDQPI